MSLGPDALSDWAFSSIISLYSQCLFSKWGARPPEGPPEDNGGAQKAGGKTRKKSTEMINNTFLFIFDQKI